MLEAQRLRMRTTYDIEMMRQIGTCSGIENYSRHTDGREPGTAPHCLLDYFPEDFLLVIDESHVTVPQIGGMYEGDMSRKRTLVEHGFRLPSAMDNRPLRWEEFLERIGQTVYLSATPGQYEQDKSDGFVEQIIRPTGLVDPEVIVKPTKGQIDDLIHEIRLRVERDERVLVTTLTKKMSEDLTDYLLEMGIRTRYLHSEVDTLRRVELLRELRMGEYDVLVGINLLREGLDLPEVSLVAILDADKEGFLRSGRSLIQTIGRAARNVSGQVFMYADKITPSMEQAIDETNRRRAKQIAYNEARRRRPAAAAEEDRRHHRHAGPRGRRHRRAARLRPEPVARQGAGARWRQGEGGGEGEGTGRRPAVVGSGRPDPAAHRPDAQRRGRAAVRGRRPLPRRDLRAEEGAPPNDERRRQVEPQHPRTQPPTAPAASTAYLPPRRLYSSDDIRPELGRRWGVMAFGEKKKAARRAAVESGGTLSGRQARKAASEYASGRLGEDGKVRDTKGEVVRDYSKRTRKQGNEHGV